METLIHADIFFFVSTISTIIFTILGIIFMVYLIRILDDVRRSTSLLEDKIHGASDDIAEIRKRVKESIIFNLLFAKKPARKQQKKFRRASMDTARRDFAKSHEKEI